MSNISRENKMSLQTTSAGILNGMKKQRNMDLGSQMTLEKKSPSKPMYVLHKLLDDSIIGLPTTLYWKK